MFKSDNAKEFCINEISTDGAYNSARYKKHGIDQYGKSLIIGYDGNEYDREAMLNAAMAMCTALSAPCVYLSDRNNLGPLLEVKKKTINKRKQEEMHL